MKKIVLASTSPRRKEILERYCKIELSPPEVDEKIHLDMAPWQEAMSISFAKAENVYHRYLNKQVIIISADTIVFLDKVIGKPKCRDDAYEIIKTLSGKKHKVYTAFTIIDAKTEKKYIDYDCTEVEFFEVTNNEIEKFLDREKFSDKAGAYAIQEHGSLLVKGINGSYENVIGLPVAKINRILKSEFGV